LHENFTTDVAYLWTRNNLLVIHFKLSTLDPDLGFLKAF